MVSIWEEVLQTKSFMIANLSSALDRRSMTNSLHVMIGVHLAENWLLLVPISAPPNEFISRGFSTESLLGSSYKNGRAPLKWPLAMLSVRYPVHPFGKFPHAATASFPQLLLPLLMVLVAMAMATDPNLPMITSYCIDKIADPGEQVYYMH